MFSDRSFRATGRSSSGGRGRNPIASTSTCEGPKRSRCRRGDEPRRSSASERLTLEPSTRARERERDERLGSALLLRPTAFGNVLLEYLDRADSQCAGLCIDGAPHFDVMAFLPFDSLRIHHPQHCAGSLIQKHQAGPLRDALLDAITVRRADLFGLHPRFRRAPIAREPAHDGALATRSLLRRCGRRPDQNESDDGCKQSVSHVTPPSVRLAQSIIARILLSDPRSPEGHLVRLPGIRGTGRIGTSSASSSVPMRESAFPETRSGLPSPRRRRRSEEHTSELQSPMYLV